MNIPGSGLSVVHLGTGLSTKESSGKCWQIYEHEHESQKGAQARLEPNSYIAREATKPQRAEGASLRSDLLRTRVSWPLPHQCTWMSAHFLSGSISNK